MSTVETTSDGSPAASTRSGLHLALGWLLPIPAALCCLSTLAWPTLQTIIISLQDVGFSGPAAFVGLENYTALAQLPVLPRSAGFTLALVLMRAAAVAVVPVLLALGLSALGPLPRRLVRVLFTLPWVLYIPVLVGLAWWAALRPFDGLLAGPGQPWLADPVRAPAAVLLIDGLYTFAVAMALGLVAYLAAFRRDDAAAGTGQGRWLSVLVVWAISLAAAVAAAFQAFSLPMVLTGGGPANSTTTLALAQFTLMAMQLRFGPAAALAVLVLVVLMMLGVGAAVLVIASGLRLRVTHAPRPAGASGTRRGLAALGTFTLLISLGPWLLSVLVPAWFGARALGAEVALPEPIAAGPVLFNTVVPAAITLLPQLALVYLAALGIGALRPLGRASEWLLLPFSPWLFVTLGPLSLAYFQQVRAAGLVNTVAALMWLPLSVPALFVLTLFFKGQASLWQAAEATGEAGSHTFVDTVIRPSLPLVVFLFVVGLLASAQEVLWPWLVTTGAVQTVSTVVLRLQGQFAADVSQIAGIAVRLGLPLFLLFFLTLGAFQLGYLDRLVLVTSGEPAIPAGPAGRPSGQGL